MINEYWSKYIIAFISLSIIFLSINEFLIYFVGEKYRVHVVIAVTLAYFLGVFVSYYYNKLGPPPQKRKRKRK